MGRLTLESPPLQLLSLISLCADNFPSLSKNAENNHHENLQHPPPGGGIRPDVNVCFRWRPGNYRVTMETRIHTPPMQFNFNCLGNAGKPVLTNPYRTSKIQARLSAGLYNAVGPKGRLAQLKPLSPLNFLAVPA